MEEEFRIIPEYPNYRVSNLGRVESNLSGAWKLRKLKRVSKGDKHGDRHYLGFNIKVYTERTASGYFKTKTLLVHNFVAALFIGPRPPGMLVLHKDDDRERNMVENIEYGTPSQNAKQAYANGKIRFVRGDRGYFKGSESS